MKKRFVLLMCLMLVFSLAFVACDNKDKPTPPDKTTVGKTPDPADEKVSIDDWAGTWNNMGAYLEDAEVEAGFKKLAEKENVTVEEAKKAYKAKRQCDFDGLVIADGKVTFLDGFKDKGAAEIETVEYEFVESVETTHGTHKLTWDVFKAKGDAKYPILLMMPVHGEEALTHFHMRYGADKDELLGKEGWYPTFVKPSSTYDQLNEEIAE